MGFFRKLLGVPSFAGSTNALLVELMLPTLTDPQRAELKKRIIEFLQNTSSTALSAEEALAILNEASRITQLNLLALAMKDLGYRPLLATERFKKVRDPFAVDLVDERTLRAVARRLKWAHGIEPMLGEDPLNFDSW